MNPGISQHRRNVFTGWVTVSLSRKLLILSHALMLSIDYCSSVGNYTKQLMFSKLLAMFCYSLYTDHWHHLQNSPVAVTAAHSAVSVSQNTTNCTRGVVPRLRHVTQCPWHQLVWRKFTRMWQHSVHISCAALNPARTTTVRWPRTAQSSQYGAISTNLTATAQQNYVHIRCTEFHSGSFGSKVQINFRTSLKPHRHSHYVHHTHACSTTSCEKMLNWIS
jgi:hypothetical protein